MWLSSSGVAGLPPTSLSATLSRGRVCEKHDEADALVGRIAESGLLAGVLGGGGQRRKAGSELRVGGPAEPQPEEKPLEAEVPAIKPATRRAKTAADRKRSKAKEREPYTHEDTGCRVKAKGPEIKFGSDFIIIEPLQTQRNRSIDIWIDEVPVPEKQ